MSPALHDAFGALVATAIFFLLMAVVGILIWVREIIREGAGEPETDDESPTAQVFPGYCQDCGCAFRRYDERFMVHHHGKARQVCEGCFGEKEQVR